MACYREGGCGPYEMYSCGECPASKRSYLEKEATMKKIRVCLEIQNAAIDEDGSPAPAGIQITIGEVPDDKYKEISYEKLAAGLNKKKLLEMLSFLPGPHSEEDIRVITPEEYDREYGEENEEE